MRTFVKTGSEIWDSFCPTIERFLSHDKSHFVINGRPVSGYRSPDTTPIWLRDHTHQMKGFRHSETDMISALDVFEANQMEDGAFYDFFKAADGLGEHDPNYHRLMHFDEASKVLFCRCGVEADVEYLAVEAVHGAWQATGDDAWMAAKLPALERGMAHSLTSPIRWSPEYQLVKRGFTIDTWDYEYGELVETSVGLVHRSEVDEKTLWCIMHGDNSGMFHASILMAKMCRHIGNSERAAYWEDRAKHFKMRTNEVCWNGRFYTHQVHITPVDVQGVDEREQLSLSNPYDMNRGLPDHLQCVSIIHEYMRRREAKKGEHVNEWYSIDPPFPSGVFGLDYLHPGVYTNGGVMPLVGGELSHAAFEHGFEGYGVDILRQYYDLAIKPGETYLWYHPDGTYWQGGSFLPTDGWGSAAMLYALVEGLCGIKDMSKSYQSVLFAPRWPAAGIDGVEVGIGYGASEAGFGYTFEGMPKQLAFTITGTGKHVNAHILLPKSQTACNVKVDGQTVDWIVSQVESSSYVDFQFLLAGAERRVQISL